jgi:beta-glucosidase
LIWFPDLIRKGADVRGYFLWTLLDSFEWTNGYTKRYGIHHVDRATLKITPKLSAAWYRQFIAQHKGIEASVPEVNPQLSQY